MKNIKGIWLPDHETHLLKFATHQGWTYQKSKLDEAMPFCTKRDLAIDIGGHCGLWSMHLVNLFNDVVAFEPVAAHRECYEMNVSGKYTLHHVALGEEHGAVSMHTTEGSSGDTWVQAGTDVELYKLDDFALKPDFIKIDTEGFELFVIRGGEKTIRDNKPVMVVEQKPLKGENFGLGEVDAIKLLESWGYVCRKVISGDYIMVWN